MTDYFDKKKPCQHERAARKTERGPLKCVKCGEKVPLDQYDYSGNQEWADY